MCGRGQRGTGIAAYLDLLRLFDEQEIQVTVVGGQAVNFWAEGFEEEEPELSQYRPFTSADLDLYRPSASARTLLRTQAKGGTAERDPFGKPFMIVSHTFLIEDGRGEILAVDDLKMVTGLQPAEVEKGAVMVEFSGMRIRVLNPIVCLKAKLHNVATIDEKGRQDVKHVCILIPCIRAFVRRLVIDAHTDGNCRPVLRALETLRSCTSRREAIRAARAHRVELIQAIPLTDLTKSQHAKLVNFSSKRLPGWLQLLRNEL